MPSSSASSAAVDGNVMSGVTVATMSRSIEPGSTPADSSACRHAGRAMSVIASSCAAMRRSRMPVRSMIHSSVVSTSVESSALVTTRSGTCEPRPVIEMGVPFALPIMTTGPPRR